MEVYTRSALLDALFPSNSGSKPLTHAQFKQHIGFKCNVNYESPQTWRKRTLKTWESTLLYNITREVL